MCGICGSISKHASACAEKQIRIMCDAIRHRGPDDHGVWRKQDPGAGEIAFGHTRLSIIDLSADGHQPMTNEDETLWLVFNGEIYNFVHLRNELLAKSHRFRSETDSEVILHLYEEEGIDCIHRLFGMFAFALWDQGKQRLLLCRDRLGIKPLVYYWDGSTFSFASEIKALLADHDVKREINWEALGLYLSLNYVPAPRTIFRNIFKLEPGHLLVIENGTLEKQKYWEVPQDTENGNDSFDDYKRELFKRMEAAVQRRLIADVPLGAFLSGGIDSSIVVGLMARSMNQPVKTFSIGYKDLSLYDESSYAKEVASFHGTEHHEFRLSSKDVLDVIPDVLDHFDEPFADSSAIPTFLVSRETRKEVTVALSGDGADELFAGYRKYTGEHWYRYYSLLPRALREQYVKRLFARLPRSRDNRLAEYLRRADKFIQGAHEAEADRIWAWREIFTEQMMNDVLLPDIRQRISMQLGRHLTKEALNRFDGDPINRMLHLDVTGSLPDDMLNKVDWMSMKHALEVRVPFLDHEVVEWAFKIPGKMKLHRGRRKFILIETFQSLLPKRIQKRPKWGFEVPISAWLKKELRYLTDNYLSENKINEQGIFNYSSIQEMVGMHMDGKREYGWQIWSLIVFGHWYEKYFNVRN